MLITESFLMYDQGICHQGLEVDLPTYILHFCSCKDEYVPTELAITRVVLTGAWLM